MRMCGYRLCRAVFGPEAHPNKFYCGAHCRNLEVYQQKKEGKRRHVKVMHSKPDPLPIMPIQKLTCKGCIHSRENLAGFMGYECTIELFSECRPDLPWLRKHYRVK